jgi:hypothetical protein
MDLHRKTTLNNAISWAMVLLLLAVLVNEIVLGQYVYAAGAVAAIIIAFLPAIISRNIKVNLPWYLEFLVLLALFLHILGNSLYLYRSIAYYDVIMHLLGTAIIALIAFLVVFVLHFTGKIKVSIRLIGIFTFIFALAVGALWEIAEFSLDQVMKTNAQMTWLDPAAGLKDTNTDLIFDALAGGIVAIIGMWYVKRISPKAMRSYVDYILQKP